MSLPKAKKRCACWQDAKDWRHAVTCEVWNEQILPSARGMLFLSPTLAKWNRLCSLFHAPPGVGIDPPHDLESYSGEKVGDRHPIYKCYTWQSRFLHDGELNYFWHWKPVDLKPPQ